MSNEMRRAVMRCLPILQPFLPIPTIHTTRVVGSGKKVLSKITPLQTSTSAANVHTATVTHRTSTVGGQSALPYWRPGTNRARLCNLCALPLELSIYLTRRFSIYYSNIFTFRNPTNNPYQTIDDYTAMRIHHHPS